MPLQLVIGPANSAKAGEVLGAYAAQAARGALLVVPTAADARHYQRELAETGVVFATVVTFGGLTAEIAARTGYGGRCLTDHQRDALLRRVVGEQSPPGLRRAAGELFAELTRNLVTPQRFTAALRAWAAEDARRAARAETLAGLPQRWGRALERGAWVDAEGYAWGALDALRAAPGRWGRDAVFFYGFDDLTRLERDAIETLDRIAGAAVTVSLTYEAGRAALAARAEVVEDLRPLATAITELPPRDTYYAPAARAALHALERGLFEPGANAADPGDAVILLEAGGARAEAELIAGRVRALIAGGMPAHEIAIVWRSLRGAAELLAQVLSEYGVPTRTSGELPFTHTTLGHALAGAARCALAGPAPGGGADAVPGATAGDLLAYLRAPGRIADAAVTDRLELELARRGEVTAAAARVRFGQALPELDALAAAPAPGLALVTLARDLQAAPRRASGAELDDEEAADARALAALARAVDERTAAGLPPDRAELLELLETLTVPGAPAREGEVVLAEPLQVRARRFRVVCVAGLQEGAFPLGARSEPFLSERDRRELAATAGLRLPRVQDTLARERYLLYAAVSRATEQVLLSYRSSDEEGNLALASPFVADLRELFGESWFARRQRRLLADVVWPAADAPTEREQRLARAAAAAPERGDAPEAERRLGAVAVARLRHREVVSAGALESYGDCPVRWLVERELQPAELAPDAEPLTRGNLIHAVLEGLLSELDGPLDVRTLPQAEAALDSHLRRLAGTDGAALGAGAPEVVRAGLLHGIRADLLRYLRHEAGSGAGWPRHGVELRFGFDAGDDAGDDARNGGRPSLPALELDGGVRLRGVIDRVDTDGAGRATITDYKSGAARAEHPAARWALDRRLQVALYLLVIRELTDLEPVGGFYQPLRGKDLRARGMYRDDVELGTAAHPRDARSAEAFEAELTGAGERAAALAQALRAGIITSCPQNCSRDGCAHPGICRSQ